MSEELWSFSHLIVTLATPKLLTLDNKNKKDFILYCARLIVSLATPKLLTLDNESKKSLFPLYCTRLIVSLQKILLFV